MFCFGLSLFAYKWKQVVCSLFCTEQKPQTVATWICIWVGSSQNLQNHCPWTSDLPHHGMVESVPPCGCPICTGSVILMGWRWAERAISQIKGLGGLCSGLPWMPRGISASFMGSRLSLCHYIDWQSSAWQLGRLVAILPFLVLLNSQTLRGEHCRSLVQ